MGGLFGSWAAQLLAQLPSDEQCFHRRSKGLKRHVGSLGGQPWVPGVCTLWYSRVEWDQKPPTLVAAASSWQGLERRGINFGSG